MEHVRIPALGSASFKAVFFGSSFNVVDQAAALAESRRILVTGGWFICMWNHRDLNDPVQNRIEDIIKSHIPDYGYGTRGEDPTSSIDASRLFGKVRHAEGRFVAQMDRNDVIEAWQSHATVARQAGGASPASSTKYGRC